MNRIKLRALWPRLLAAAFLALLALSSNTWAGLQIPYAPDSKTLHLWHLDDPNGLTSTDAVTTASITLTNLGLPTPGTFPYNNTSLGNPSFPGMGTCMSGTNKSHLLYGGNFPNVSQFQDNNTGAFTFEALVYFTINPLGAIDAEIVAGDNGGAISARGWQWRIFNGVMEWDLLGGSTDNDFKAALPATGPNAAIIGTWYHVAVTYTGDAPTNGDTPNLITFYWTLLDANRVVADKLASFTATRNLSGAGVGTGYNGTVAPNLGIGGSGRAITGTNPGNSEGIFGSVDEVRISSVARTSNQMAFVTGGALNPPTFTKQPPASTLSGYGQTLTIPALVSGTPPLSFQWRQNGVVVPGQADTTLSVPNTTFASSGQYLLVVTNLYGRATSTVDTVTIGAIATELANTGLDTNGLLSAGDIADPHWTLHQSADANYPGPQTLIFENSNPLQFASPNGSFSPTNSASMWMGLAGNSGGFPLNSPAGKYYYRATFVIDQADASTLTMGGNLWVNGSITDILVNGKSSGVTVAPGGTLYVGTWAISNGFIPGINTLDFVETTTGSTISALRVEVSSIGQALPPGLPLITNQPVDRVVRDGNITPGSDASFSVVALGRPPLNYQWYADGQKLTGSTTRTLSIPNPSSGSQGTNFLVVVSNDSGSVTSSVARLTIVPTNQPPVPATYNAVSYSSQTFTLLLSRLVQDSIDPDGELISFSGFDGASTNGASITQSGATLVYTPVSGYVGPDQFTYTISDAQGTPSVGYVNLLSLQAPLNQSVLPGGSASFDVGLTSQPAGFKFQWQYDGTDITGATNISLAVSNAQISNAGSYTLNVTGSTGGVWTSPIAGLTVGTPGSGTGLTGDYYTSMTNGFGNFNGTPTLTRLDPTIDFNFGSGAPDPSISATYFMVRWHGQVQPLYSGLYKFSTTSDDGSRLWVNGQLVVSQWQAQGAATVSGNLQLTAGQKYDLVLEYFQVTGPDVISLNWSSPNQAPEVIPMPQLYPGTGLASPTLTTSVSTKTNLTLNWAGTFNLQSATKVTGPWTTIAPTAVGPYRTNLTQGTQMYFRLLDPLP